MVPEDDARRTVEYDDFFIIQPDHEFWNANVDHLPGGRACPENFRYSSETNTWWLTKEELTKMIS
jgi:UDP-N-acetylglucosamine 4,6-dehydratase/5-epimerase